MTSLYYNGSAFVRCREAAKTEALLLRLEDSLAQPAATRPPLKYRGVSYARLCKALLRRGFFFGCSCIDPIVINRLD